jgi:leucyl aminopeptidase
MKLLSIKSTLKQIKSDAVAVFIFEDKKFFQQQMAELKKPLKIQIERIIELEGFKGKTRSIASSYTDNKIASPRIILVGLGEQKKIIVESYRKAGALAAKTAKSLKVKKLAIQFPQLPERFKATIEDITQSIGEGALLSQYKFDKYITSKKEDEVKLGELTIFSNQKSELKLISDGVKTANIICDGVILARNLVNAPASEIYPDTLARAAKESSEKFGFKATVWDEKKIKQEGFGGLIGVSQGSTKPPRFIILEHNADIKELSTIVLVGKGITFDSGGISLKPSSKMYEMKMDMAGAAAVIGTLQTVARLKIPFHIVGLIPTTENMPSGSALKPSDIIKHYGGKTSEVEDTDAEGRLILADALAYAHNFNPKAVIDLATLTGAVVVALGYHATGILGNDDELISKIKTAGDITYERVWQLPMFDEYEIQIKSDIADVKNLGSRGAGTITAAMFLKKFISDKNKKEYKWAHLDIAGTAMMDESNDYIQKGGSGVGVRLLVEFLKNSDFFLV